MALSAKEQINPAALRYANRLSDHLFVMARTANDCGMGDVLWVPGEIGNLVALFRSELAAEYKCQNNADHARHRPAGQRQGGINPLRHEGGVVLHPAS